VFVAVLAVFDRWPVAGFADWITVVYPLRTVIGAPSRLADALITDKLRSVDTVEAVRRGRAVAAVKALLVTGTQPVRAVITAPIRTAVAVTHRVSVCVRDTAYAFIALRP
jgi:hypothetical protein